MALDPATERRIDDLLLQMTLDEKVGQLNQINDDHGYNLDKIRKGQVGSILAANHPNAGNVAQQRLFADYLNGIQRVAVEESRLGIPLLIGRDVIHGHRTVAPIPIGQACSWDRQLVKACAQDSACEARADGIHWTFTPMLDIARDPRWGRIAEGFGEDPYLASQLAKAAVEGYQGDFSETNLLACAKHYMGYGAAEGGRDYNTTEITPSTLRNVYAPPFKAAVEAGVGSVMSAFHEINGIPATADRHLLTEILKDEWGFDGFVVSDWGAVDELVDHGVAANRREAARLAIEAGLDMDMVMEVYHDELARLVADGVVSESAIDEAVRRVLRAKFRLGLFERPYANEAMAEKTHLRPDHVDRARKIAQESIVLLKNDGVLPLPKTGTRIGVFGPMASVTGVLFGTWTLDGQASDVTSILDAVRQQAEGIVHMGLTDDMLSAGRHCDTIVAVVGESSGRSGEDNSVMSLDLPSGQLELLKDLKALGRKLVVVVVAGRSLAIPWVLEHADAVVWAFHPGVEGGHAIADVLFGDVNPSGKLVVSFPRSVGQVPIYYNHKSTGRPLNPAEKHTRYVDGSDQPLLPFGYGLSYTRFEYSDLRIDVGETIVIRATVANIGDREGSEVAQLYVRDLVGSIARPIRELKGFQRLALESGQSEEVVFELQPNDLGFYDNQERFRVEPGCFKVWVGPNSAEGLEGEFELA